MLAKIQQQLLDSKQFKSSKFHGKTNAPVPKFDSKPGQYNSGLWKERQLRDFRKASGLCIYCGDKFNAAHAASCTKRPQAQAQVHAIVVNDLDTELSEETLNQLAIEDAIAEDLQKLSLNAISGTAEGEVLKIKAMVKNKVMLILLDSGSSHSFVNSSFLNKVGIIPNSMTPRKVKVANGHTLISDKIVPQMQWWCQGHTLVSDMQVLELGAYDAILGYDWLKQHSPMCCDWEQHTVESQEKGRTIKLQGVHPGPLTLSEISAANFHKSYKSNDVWALAVVNFVQPVPEVVSEEIATVLKEFEDVFAKPSELPPTRVYDHAVPLVPDAVPVNSRPYRYSPVQKDEIERQVKELLESGLIVQSTSPFASPVLLVQKKDVNWRFCVDYRRLNELTIKNRFPMPIIEEI